jgi:hypothetical protein
MLFINYDGGLAFEECRDWARHCCARAALLAAEDFGYQEQDER